MESIAILSLAAGLGKRMGRDVPKVLICTRSKSLIEHQLETIAKLSPEKVVIVVGHKRGEVEKAASEYAANYSLKNVEFAVQEEQNGTGDAVRTALGNLKNFTGTVLIIYGDIPALKYETLSALFEVHQKEKATLTLIALKGDAENAYGRIVRDDAGNITKIVELKDCSPEQKLIDETNAGIYAVDSSFLGPAVEALTNDNAQGEYYLTDIVEKAYSEGQIIASLVVYDETEIQGVNTLHDLCLVNKTLRMRKVKEFIDSGVVVEDPSSLFIDDEVQIAPGVQIGPSVILKGSTVIEEGVIFEGSAFLKDTHIGKGTVVKFSVRAEGARVGANVMLGPFAHLRPGTVLDDEVKVGNFVESKNSHLEKGAKVSHLSYIGDSTIGSGANIGAGTITANYDGYQKHKTTVGAGASIGSNSVLVAPVTIGEGATVGAGSVISKDVEKDSLVLTRAQLKTKSGWSKAKRENSKKEKR